ncbi:MAG: hypothetical protein ACK47B_03790 [Armatimonadota bacterium]
MVVTLAAALLCGAAPTSAAPKRPEPVSLLHALIPQPTGQNGYEELLLAADLLREARLLEEIEKTSWPRLSLYRPGLEERPAREAWHLLRRGLRKRIIPPPPDRQEIHFTAHHRGLMRLSELLVARVRFLMSEGRTSEAVETVVLGFQLGQAVEEGSALGAVNGRSLRSAVTDGVAPYVEQLSASDCETLLRRVGRFIPVSSPLEQVVHEDYRQAAQRVVQLRRDVRLRGEAALDALAREVLHFNVEFTSVEQSRGSPCEEAVGDLFLLEFPRQYGASLPELLRFVNDLDAAVAQRAQRLLAHAREPGRELVPICDPPEPEPARIMAREMLSRSGGQVSEAPEEEVPPRLLLVHLAILRYRWEHDRLPSSLAELNLGELAIDPFSGLPLEYEPLGTRTYRLRSIGPLRNSLQPDRYERCPISLGGAGEG